MTNVPLGDIPDVFKAGAAFPGMPFALVARRTSAPQEMGMDNEYVNGI
jgi:hypothetical protein